MLYGELSGSGESSHPVTPVGDSLVGSGEPGLTGQSLTPPSRPNTASDGVRVGAAQTPSPDIQAQSPKTPPSTNQQAFDLDSLSDATLPQFIEPQLIKPELKESPNARRDASASIPLSSLPFSPRPNPAAMDFLSALNEHLLLRGPAIIRELPFFRDLPALQGWMRVTDIDFPDEDIQRLRKYTRSDSVAFVTPNHPEVMTDWQMDKEVARLCAPRLAFWAADDVVNMNRRMREFWLSNNLIPNGAGEAGKLYSVEWALKGNGVLIHPEGAVHWTTDMVGELIPGVVDMSLRAKRELATRGDARPVYITPVIYRYTFGADVSIELSKEIKFLERRLELESGEQLALGPRFAQLQCNLLTKRMERLGFNFPGGINENNFFVAQAEFRESILKLLESKYDISAGPDWERVRVIRRRLRDLKDIETPPEQQPKGPLSALKRLLDNKPKQLSELALDRKLLNEATRLEEFNEYVYGGERLSQEQIAESLKRLRLTYLTTNLADTKHIYAPTAVAPRTAHVRVLEPLALDWRHQAFPYETKSFKESLLATLWELMQTGVDSLREETAPRQDPFAHENPFTTQA